MADTCHFPKRYVTERTKFVFEHSTRQSPLATVWTLVAAVVSPSAPRQCTSSALRAPGSPHVTSLVSVRRGQGPRRHRVRVRFARRTVKNASSHGPPAAGWTLLDGSPDSGCSPDSRPAVVRRPPQLRTGVQRLATNPASLSVALQNLHRQSSLFAPRYRSHARASRPRNIVEIPFQSLRTRSPPPSLQPTSSPSWSLAS